MYLTNHHAHGFVGGTACLEQRVGTMGNYSSWSIVWRACSSCHHPLRCDEDPDDDCPSRHASLHAVDSLLHPPKRGAPRALQGCDPALLLDRSSRSNELRRLRARQEGHDRSWEWDCRPFTREEEHGGFERMTDTLNQSTWVGWLTPLWCKERTGDMQQKFLCPCCKETRQIFHTAFLPNDVRLYPFPSRGKHFWFSISIGLCMYSTLDGRNYRSWHAALSSCRAYFHLPCAFLVFPFSLFFFLSRSWLISCDLFRDWGLRWKWREEKINKKIPEPALFWEHVHIILESIIS